jgi:hypothetical protein
MPSRAEKAWVRRNSMTTIFRINFDKERREIIDRVGREMGIENYRGYVLFDDNDYANDANPTWRKQALHLNVRRGVEEMSPEHILQLINSPNCDHFVWLSKRIAEGEKVHMVWVYAHELRHVIQDTLYPGLSEITGSLQKVLSGYQIEFPQELDAELAARSLVLKFFGEEEYADYRRRQCADNPKAADYFRRFDQLAANWCDDPITETKRLLASV